MSKVKMGIQSAKMKLYKRATGMENRFFNARGKKRLLRKKSLASILKKISSSFILFDWEFFSNELEYE